MAARAGSSATAKPATMSSPSASPNALGLMSRSKRVEPTGIHKLLSPWIGVAHREHFGEPDSAFAPPWPDVAISIGRLTTPYIRELKRLCRQRHASPSSCKTRKSPLSTADLFWVPEHDQLRGRNVITTLTAPHGFTAGALASFCGARCRRDYGALRQPRVAVLLGGSNGDYTYFARALGRLARGLTAFGNNGASFLITPSRAHRAGDHRVRAPRDRAVSAHLLGYARRQSLRELPCLRGPVRSPCRQHQHDRRAMRYGTASIRLPC